MLTLQKMEMQANETNPLPLFDAADINLIAGPEVNGYRPVVGSNGLRFDANGQLCDRDNEALQGQILYVRGLVEKARQQAVSSNATGIRHERSKILAAALVYAGELGWRVFPVWPIRHGRCACGNSECKSPGKHPVERLTGDWRKSATTEQETVCQWWNQIPDANIATPDFLRIDVDTKEGALEWWEEMLQKHGRPDTPHVFTPSGGEHWYFQAPAGWEHNNRTGRLPKGIDVRGHGTGYTLLPPSNHLSGTYEWELSSRPVDIPIAPLPDWLADLLREDLREPAGQVMFNQTPTEKPVLSQFNLSTALTALIEHGHPPGCDRSETDQSVITALLRGGATEEQVKAVFDHYPIGTAGKYAEKGGHGEKYLAHSISKAHAHLRSQNGIGPAGELGGLPPIKPISMAELMSRQYSPRQWLIEGLLAKGNCVVLGGRPKSGKTWLALQMVACVDTGQPFLGRDTVPGRVLYIALEDGERRMYERGHLLRWQPQQADIHFSLAALDNGRGLPGSGLSQIAELAAHYDLIILDTLIASLSGALDENDNASMGAILNNLARIAHGSETAVMVIHHTGKAINEDVFNSLRGASAIRGAYDLGLILERRPGEREAVLHAESRDFDVDGMTLRQVENGAGWEYVGGKGELKKLRAGRETLEAMLELDPNGEGLTVKEIAQHREVSASTIYRQLNGLLKGGYVSKDEQPSTADGKTADLWHVAEPYRQA